jgi:methyl-accepting chemotaxis protein
MNAFVARLSLRHKFLLITLAMLMPLAALVVMTTRLELEKIGVAAHEGRGLGWASELIAIAANLSEYREHAIAVAGGAEDERAEMAEHAASIRAAASNLDALAAGGDAEFLTASGWDELRPRVAAAVEGEGSSALQLRNGPTLIADLHTRVLTIAEQSELILDPGADTFPLMFSALFDLPKGIEALATARRSMDLVAGGDTSVSTYMQLAAQGGEARSRLRSGMHFIADNYARNATVESDIDETATAYATRLEAALRAIDTMARDGIDAKGAKQMSIDIEVLTEDLSALRDATDHELRNLLAARARHSEYLLGGEIGLVALFIGLAFWVQSRVTRYIGGKLEAANQVFDKLSQGQFDSEIGAQSADELGHLMTALGNMQDGLAARVNADRKGAEADRIRAIEVERIKQALDASSVNVVVADEQSSIIYLNPAARRLMAGAAADFRQVSPRFDAQRLVGSGLDAFGADGAWQRDTIAALREPVTTRVVVGSRTFQTIASPIMDAGGKRIGTVVEWLERTQEVAAEEEIGNLVAAVSDGKLDQRVSLDGKTGFFGVLAKGLNGLVATVSDVVTQTNQLVSRANEGDLTRTMDLDGKSGLYVSIGAGVNSLIGNMAGVVSQVKSMAGQVHLGAEEISKGNSNLSARTEQQASSLEETASSMEEMTSTVKQTADNASQANQLAMAARQEAEKGGSVVSAAVTAMGAINEASRKIADIIGVIDEIAFQTNLLALNAAVEAARAGEQGRGFAVVATEVRSLAGRSASAAKEIKALIQDSVAKVDEGSRLVDESGRTLEEIVIAVKKVTDVVAEIAAASREQSSGIEQVNKAVIQMDEGTQQNAALVEQASAASQAIVEQMQALGAMIARYEVGDARGAPAASRPEPARPERRSKDRPWSKAPARKATMPARKAHASSGDDEWNEF